MGIPISRLVTIVSTVNYRHRSIDALALGHIHYITPIVHV